MNVVDSLKPGDKIFYPSDSGIALICQVLSLSSDDVLVQIDDKKFFLPKESVESYAVVMDKVKASTYVTQRLDDPDNSLIYLRYTWRETLLDKVYNWYCRRLKRVDTQVIPPVTSTEAHLALPPSSE